MAGLFSILLLVSIVAMVIGLFKPEKVIRWGKKRTRGRVILYGFIAMFFSIIMIGAFAENESTPTAANETVQQIGESPTANANGTEGSTKHPSENENNETADDEEADPAKTNESNTNSAVTKSNET